MTFYFVYSVPLCILELDIKLNEMAAEQVFGDLTILTKLINCQFNSSVLSSFLLSLTYRVKEWVIEGFLSRWSEGRIEL